MQNISRSNSSRRSPSISECTSTEIRSSPGRARRSAMTLPKYSSSSTDCAMFSAARLRARVDDGVGPALEPLAVGAGHTEHVPDHQQRQRRGEGLDEVDGRRARRCRRCSSRTNSPMRSSSARSRPGLNAGWTSLRYFTCSGGSM